MACGAEAASFWRFATPPDVALARSDRYPLFRCRACGTATTVAEAENENLLYTEGAYAPPAKWSRTLVPLLRRLLALSQRRFVGDLGPRAAVVDVGGGHGDLARALADRGADVQAIDPHSAPTIHPSLLRRAGWRDAEIQRGSQDAVILWHVLEHLHEPAQALRHVRTWLRAEGRLFVAVPNLASLQATLGRDAWFQQDVPRHRTHFTRQGLVRCLGRAGFDIEQVRQTYLDQSVFGMWQTLVNTLTSQRNVLLRLVKAGGDNSKRAPARDLAVVTLVGPPLLGVALLLEAAALATRAGGSIVASARPAPGE
jgi:predicted SAM-dependent methyltransferase